MAWDSTHGEVVAFKQASGWMMSCKDLARLSRAGLHRGDVYVGNIKDGMMHGRGKYHFHMHNEDFQKLSGGKAIDLSDIAVRSGKYWILDVIHDHNEVVAVCGIHEHEDCE